MSGTAWTPERVAAIVAERRAACVILEAIDDILAMRGHDDMTIEWRTTSSAYGWLQEHGLLLVGRDSKNRVLVSVTRDGHALAVALREAGLGVKVSG